MPFAAVNGTTLHYRIDGDDAAPPILLSNSLASNLTMWDDQIETLLGLGYRVVRYDSRGHGQSGVTPGPYTVEQLAQDAAGLLDELGIEKTTFMGLSKGGMVGQMLGTRHGDRIDRLVLCATASYMGGPETWQPRIDTVAAQGMGAVADATIERWFTKPGQERMPEAVARVRQMIVETPAEGFCACAGAIRDMDQRETIRAVTAPTLVVVGEHDPGTPPSAAALIHDRIAGSELEVLDDCAHFLNVEQKGAFNATIARFLAR